MSHYKVMKQTGGQYKVVQTFSTRAEAQQEMEARNIKLINSAYRRASRRGKFFLPFEAYKVAFNRFFVEN